MAQPRTEAISPFFIVSNVDQTIAFYRDKLGFEMRFQQPDRSPFFAIVGRDGAQLFVKSDPGTLPLPNSRRNPFIEVGCVRLYARSGCARSRIFRSWSGIERSP